MVCQIECQLPQSILAYISSTAGLHQTPEPKYWSKAQLSVSEVGKTGSLNQIFLQLDTKKY